VPKSYKKDNWGNQVSSLREYVKRGLERVKLKNLQLGAVARERLVNIAGWKKA
jgi:hypothetical protein